MEKNKKLVTHSGSFHTDDIFATVVLSMVLEKANQKFEIIRSRDPEVIESADYVYDVGGVYDEASNRFDHHQAGGAGKNEFGIEYSSLGLVWKKFGVGICGSQRAADIVNKKLVSPIDAGDNGMDLFASSHEISPYLLQYFFFSMVPTWREKEVSKDKMFFESAGIAKVILLREIAHAESIVEAEESIMSIYENTEDKRVIVFDEDYPSAEIVQNLPEVLFIVYPRSDKTWGAKAVRNDIKSFKNRKNLPAAWAGLKDEELQKVSGVPDAVFCHRALFMAVAKSREGAIALAELARDSKE